MASIVRANVFTVFNLILVAFGVLTFAFGHWEDALFIGIVGALALAFAIAFGLGGREVAAEITRGWYERGQGATRKLATYAERRRVDRERISVAGEPVGSGTTIRPAGDRT